MSYFSDATNLVPDDTNMLKDVFLHSSGTVLGDMDCDGDLTLDEIRGNGETMLAFVVSLSSHSPRLQSLLQGSVPLW